MNTSTVASIRSQVIQVLVAGILFGFAFNLTFKVMDLSAPVGICLLTFWVLKMDDWFRPSFDLVGKLLMRMGSRPALLSPKASIAFVLASAAALYGGNCLADMAAKGTIWAVRIVWTIASAYIG